MGLKEQYANWAKKARVAEWKIKYRKSLGTQQCCLGTTLLSLVPCLTI